MSFPDVSGSNGLIGNSASSPLDEAPCGDMTSEALLALRPHSNGTDVMTDDMGYSKGGRTRFSDIPVKDMVIVFFMLGLWLYSILLIVRAWAKIHVLPDSATNIGGNMWKFVMEYLHKKRKGANGTPDELLKTEPRLSLSSTKKEEILLAPFSEGIGTDSLDKCVINIEVDNHHNNSFTNGHHNPEHFALNQNTMFHSGDASLQLSCPISPHPVPIIHQQSSSETIGSKESSTITDKGIIINFHPGLGFGGHQVNRGQSPALVEDEDHLGLKEEEPICPYEVSQEHIGECDGNSSIVSDAELSHNHPVRIPLIHTCSNPSFSVSKDFELSPELVERLTSNQVVNFHSNPVESPPEHTQTYETTM